MGYETEKIELRKLKTDVVVKFKFLSKKLKDATLDEVYQANTNNLSADGALMVSPNAPFIKWINELVSQEILLGMNIFLPSEEAPLKVLGRFARLEVSENHPGKIAVGVKFKQISAQDKDKIFKFIIKSQFTA